MSNVLMNLLAATDLPSLCVEYISISLFSDHNFIDLLTLLIFSNQYLVWFTAWFFHNFSKCSSNRNIFLSFKAITHAYLLKTSMMHNKKMNSFVFLIINYTSAKWATHISFINNWYILPFLNFLIICLSN